MKKGIKIKQQDQHDCGAACLCSIGTWLGVKMPQAKIRALCGCTAEGITIKGIIEGAGKMGLSAKAYKSPDKKIDSISGIKTPFIAHIKTDDGYLHFIVIYRVEKEHILIMDPAYGAFSVIPHPKFREQWSGYIIIIVPGDGFIKKDETSSLFIRLISILHFHKKEIILALAGSAVLVIIGVSNSIFLQKIIDDAIPGGNIPMLAAISVLIFILTSFSLYIGYARTMFLIRNSIKIDTRLIFCYLEKLFKLPVEFFHRYSGGDINSRIGDAFKITAFISEGLVSAMISIITLTASFIIMFLYNGRLASLILLFIPLYAGLYYISAHINKKYNHKLAVCGARFQSDILDSLNGIMTIKHFGAEALSAGKIEKSYTDLAYNLSRAGKAVNISGIIGEGITKTLTATILLGGSFYVLNKGMSVGELVSFYTLSSMFTSPLNNLINMNNMVAEAVVSSERLFEIMDMEQEAGYEEEFNKYPPAIPDTVPDITISDLSFSYPGRNPVFSNLNITVPAGKITILKGESGCGKSTLGALLLRDFDPVQGKIFLGGTDIKTINIKQWREYITIVPQKSHLFDCPLLENITSGDAYPDMTEIMKICSDLGMMPLIKKLPSGLMTNIGKEGIYLSGGEIQKISVARALYKNPGIIIFDEATSSLDEASETFILNKMSALKDEGKTIIMITHKTAHTEYADKIINIK